ncbi:MAG: hypothetical protein KBA66_06310 [Leptospiraceae bacterium]|nr:hypothetical protein [Leptospiraceae bacterium]
MKEKKVLVVTGSFLIDDKSTFSSFLKKQFAKSSYASHEWLEHRIKSLVWILFLQCPNKD